MDKTEFMEKHAGHDIYCVDCDDPESECNCHVCEQWCSDCSIMSFEDHEDEQ